MGLYYSYLFPWLLDRTMSSEVLTEQRRMLIPTVQGSVLEVGFGTGRNLPFYSEGLKQLTVIEPNGKLSKKAHERIAKSRIHVETLTLDAGAALPLEENTFDAVVSTWTLCSIQNIQRALEEIHRVLKPGGSFVFIEHGLSPEPSVARWQNRLDGIQEAMAGGCHLNRNMAKLIGESPLLLNKCDEFYLSKTPRIWGYTYRGIASKE